MPDNKFTSWVHGSAMQVEYLPRITAVRHTGPFVRIEGAGGPEYLGPFSHSYSHHQQRHQDQGGGGPR